MAISDEMPLLPLPILPFTKLVRARRVPPERHTASRHLIEQPIEAVCSAGPRPVSQTCFIAS